MEKGGKKTFENINKFKIQKVLAEWENSTVYMNSRWLRIVHVSFDKLDP